MAERFETGPERHEAPDDRTDEGRRRVVASFAGHLAVEHADRDITPTKRSPEPRSELARATLEDCPGQSSSWAGTVRERTLAEPMTVYRVQTLSKEEAAAIEASVAGLPEGERDAAREQRVEAAFQAQLGRTDKKAALWCTKEHYGDLAVANSESAVPPEWRKHAAYARVYATEVPRGMTVYEGLAKRQTTVPDADGTQVRAMWDGRGYGEQVYLPRDLDENKGTLTWRRVDGA